MAERHGCCSVGFNGNWTIEWLPKGYGPSPQDFLVCVVTQPPGEDWERYGLSSCKRPPLVEMLCAVIEAYMRADSARENT